MNILWLWPGHVVQSVTCLTTDMCLTADLGVRFRPGPIDHEIISTAILLPSADSRRVPIGILGQVWYLVVLIPDLCTLTYFVVSYKGKYVHEVLVNCLVNHAQEKSVVRWTDCPNMTIAVDWDVKNQTKQTMFWLLEVFYHGILQPNYRKMTIL